MSHIGSLEQFGLSSILQRIEAHAKTGLLTVKSDQGNGGTRPHVVELYFRQGSLMYVGPTHPNQVLGQRLVEDNLISASMLQETLVAVGIESPTETRLALTLIDRGIVTQELLRAWATAKVRIVLQTLLQLSQGTLDFEEDILPPPGSLLVTLSASSLLATLTGPKPATPPIPPDVAPMPQAPQHHTSDVAYAAPSVPSSTTPAPRQPFAASPQIAKPATLATPSVERIPTLTGAEQFLNDTLASTDSPTTLSSTTSKNQMPSIFDIGYELGWEAPRSARPEQSEPSTPPAGLTSPFMRPSAQSLQAPQPFAPVQAVHIDPPTQSALSPYPPIPSAPVVQSFQSLGATPQTPPPDEDSQYVNLGLVDADSLPFSFAEDEPEPARAPMPPIAPPIIPRRIDTSFMQPDMLLLPADLSAFREKNPTVQLTPDQWRLLTRINGRVTLQIACIELGMHPDQVCSVAGELLSVGLILLSPSASTAASPQYAATLPREHTSSPLRNGYSAPSYPALTPAGTSAPSTGPVFFDTASSTTGSYRQTLSGQMSPVTHHTGPQLYTNSPGSIYAPVQQDSRRALI